MEAPSWCGARLEEAPSWPGARLVEGPPEEGEADIWAEVARVAKSPCESCSMTTTDLESAASRPGLSPSCSFHISDDTS